jgi:hypothetical protein
MKMAVALHQFSEHEQDLLIELLNKKALKK